MRFRCGEARSTYRPTNKKALGKTPKGFGLIRHPTRRFSLPVGVISRQSGGSRANPIAETQIT